jgi:hypothetical protein
MELCGISKAQIFVLFIPIIGVFSVKFADCNSFENIRVEDVVQT